MLNLEHLMSNIYSFEISKNPKSIQFIAADGCHEGGTTVSHVEMAILQQNLKELLDVLDAKLDSDKQ